MAKTWILVANACQARIYFRNGIKQELALVKEMIHPESRMKNADLVSDRAGSMPGTGNGQGSKQPQAIPKQNEAMHFAQELAQTLNQGRCSQQFERIILVAPPAFMGLLSEKLDVQTNKFVTDRLGKDYTQATEKELVGFLA
ncbi:MAG: host attachment protein [Formivibrio sp.]|nr:host attachment protein [Formivibrio sp.]